MEKNIREEDKRNIFLWNIYGFLLIYFKLFFNVRERIFLLIVDGRSLLEVVFF